ncbi:MAG: FAD-dependent monooxygenase, partial [Actinomycetota bacterium]
MSGPVIISGAGPVGLITALGLLHYGLDVVVLEEDDQLSRDTKAGTVLTRTIEVLDRYGVAPDVLSRALRIDEIGDVDRETGETQRSIKTWLLRDETRYPFVINIPQHFLEPVLADALEKRAPGALRMGHRLVGFRQDEAGVVVTAETRDGPVELEGEYLLACDGGRSTVRKALEIGVEGTTFPERYMLVDVAVDLDVDNPRDYPYLAYFAHPQEWMILVRQPEFWRFLYPRAADSPELDDAELAEKVRTYIGDVDHLDVVGYYDYTVHARAAERWRDGRVFLMGDAAHLITPMWALGLNTGVLDASNLPWRLAWVSRGWADPSLLDGYEAEQAPLARHGSAAMAQAASEYMSRRSQSLEAMTQHDWANAMTRAMLAVRLDVDGTGDWALTPDGSDPAPCRWASGSPTWRSTI